MLKKVKKTFYVILALVMCVNLLPVKAFADEVEDVQVNAENVEAGNEAASDEATLDEKDIDDVLEAAESELPTEEKAEEKDEDPDLAPADQVDVKKEQLEEKEPEEAESKEELTEEKASEKADAEEELVEEKTSEKADVKEEPDEEKVSEKANAEEELIEEKASEKADAEEELVEKKASEKADVEQELTEEKASEKADVKEELIEEKTPEKVEVKEELVKEKVSEKITIEEKQLNEKESEKADVAEALADKESEQVVSNEKQDEEQAVTEEEVPETEEAFDSSVYAGQSYYITRGGWFLNNGKHLRTSDPGGTKAWTFVTAEDGSYYLKQGNKYLSRSSETDEWEIVSSVKDAGRFTLEAGKDGNIRISQVDAPNDKSYLGIGTDPMDHKFEYARAEQDETGGTDLLLFQDIDLTGDEYVLYTQGADEKYYAITVGNTEEGAVCTAAEVEIVNEDVNQVKSAGDESLTYWKFDKQGAVKSNIYTTIVNDAGEDETVYLFADGKTMTLSDSVHGFNISKRNEGDYGEGDLYRFVGSQSHTAPVYSNGGFSANGTIDIRNAWFRLAKIAVDSVSEALEAAEENSQEMAVEEAILTDEKPAAGEAAGNEEENKPAGEQANPEEVKEPETEEAGSEEEQEVKEPSAEEIQSAIEKEPARVEAAAEGSEPDAEPVVKEETATEESEPAAELEPIIGETALEDLEPVSGQDSAAEEEPETDRQAPAPIQVSAKEPKNTEAEAYGEAVADTDAVKGSDEHPALKGAGSTDRKDASQAGPIPAAAADKEEEDYAEELTDIIEEEIPLAVLPVAAEQIGLVKEAAVQNVTLRLENRSERREVPAQTTVEAKENSRAEVKTFSGPNLVAAIAGLLLAAIAAAGSRHGENRSMWIVLTVSGLAVISVALFLAMEDITGAIRWAQEPSLVLIALLIIEAALTAKQSAENRKNRADR